MTVNIKQLAEQFADVHGVSRAAGERAVRDVFGLVKEALERHEEVSIPDFGKFSVKRKPARNGRNPKTGETIVIEARTVTGFKPALALREAVSN